MRFQICIMSENPPSIDGVKWNIKKEKSFSNPMDFDKAIQVKERLPLNSYVELYAEEVGGGKTNTGSAVIVCSPHGEQLRPIYKGRLANGVHAVFVGKSLVEVKVEWWDKESPPFGITIVKYSSNGDQFILWEGELQDIKNIRSIPLSVNKFRKPIISAMMKAKCFHCRESHYVMGES